MQKWRAEFRVEELTLADVRDEIARARAWFHFRDKDGRPMCVIKANRHIAATSVVEQVMKMVVWYFDTAQALYVIQSGSHWLPWCNGQEGWLG